MRLNWPPKLYPEPLEAMRLICCVNYLWNASAEYGWNCAKRKFGELCADDQRILGDIYGAWYLLAFLPLESGMPYDWDVDHLDDLTSGWNHRFEYANAIENLLLGIEESLRQSMFPEPSELLRQFSFLWTPRSYESVFQEFSKDLFPNLKQQLDSEQTIAFDTEVKSLITEQWTTHASKSKENRKAFLKQSEALSLPVFTANNEDLGEYLLNFVFKLQDYFSLYEPIEQFDFLNEDAFSNRKSIPVDSCVDLPTYDPFSLVAQIECLSKAKLEQMTMTLPFCDAWNAYQEVKHLADAKEVTFVEWLSKTTNIAFSVDGQLYNVDEFPKDAPEWLTGKPPKLPISQRPIPESIPELGEECNHWIGRYILMSDLFEDAKSDQEKSNFNDEAILSKDTAKPFIEAYVAKIELILAEPNELEQTMVLALRISAERCKRYRKEFVDSWPEVCAILKSMRICTISGDTTTQENLALEGETSRRSNKEREFTDGAVENWIEVFRDKRTHSWSELENKHHISQRTIRRVAKKLGFDFATHTFALPSAQVSAFLAREKNRTKNSGPKTG